MKKKSKIPQEHIKVIDDGKLWGWLNMQLEDLRMLYDAMGNDVTFGAIKAYEAMLPQLKLIRTVCND